MTTLEQGAIRKMVSMPSGSKEAGFKPVLQITNIRAVTQGNQRFRIALSDGENWVQGMLATQLNNLIHNNEITEFSVVRVEDYMNNIISGRTIIIVLAATVLPPNPGSKIGNPTDIAKDPAAASAPGAAAVSPPAPMYGNTYNNSASAVPVRSSNVAVKSSSNNPYAQAAPPAFQMDNSAVQSAPIVRSMASGPHATPIAQLNMYQNRWTIRARVTSKSDIRTWSNARGEGSLFSIELLDSSMDIRATFFKEAVDRFYNMIQEGKVYTLSGGRLKVANAQYNTCKSQYEITFDQNSEIHLSEESGVNIPNQNYDFVKIADIESMEAGKTIDVVAVVKQVSEPANLISKKTGQELIKCDLTLVDDSHASITATVWGEKANSAATEFAGEPVVAFRRLRIGDYGGKTLSTSHSGSMQVNPQDVPEAQALNRWWQSGGRDNAATKSLSSGVGGGGRADSLADRKPLSVIQDENLGHGEKPDYVSFKGTLTFLKKDREGGAWYPACANAGDPCKNLYKATQLSDGNWHCEKCNGTFQDCVRRWIFMATLSDDTSTRWVSVFNEQAEFLFGGATADRVYKQTQQGDNPDQDAYDSYFAKATNTEWIVRCKIKNEVYNNESRVKTQIMNIFPVDYAKESRDLLHEIGKF